MEGYFATNILKPSTSLSHQYNVVTHITVAQNKSLVCMKYSCCNHFKNVILLYVFNPRQTGWTLVWNYWTLAYCKEVYFSCSKPLLRTFIYITIDSLHRSSTTWFIKLKSRECPQKGGFKVISELGSKHKMILRSLETDFQQDWNLESVLILWLS